MAFVDVGTLFNAVSGGAAVNIPSHSSGDILVLCVGTTQDTTPASTIDTPGGALTWTERLQAEAGNFSAVACAIFTAVGDGVQTSVTVTVTGGTQDPGVTASVHAYSGRSGTVETVTAVVQESGVNIDAPSITPSVAGADVVRCFNFDDAESTEADHDSNGNWKGTSRHYGELGDFGDPAANGQACASSSQENVPASATGTSTYSSNGDSDAGVALTIALLPAAAAPGEDDGFLPSSPGERPDLVAVYA